MKVDLKYRIPLTGEHARIQGMCNDCRTFVGVEFIERHIIGFNDFFCVLECPSCFTKQCFHHGDIFYEMFLDSIEDGTQLHWDKNGRKTIKN